MFSENPHGNFRAFWLAHRIKITDMQMINIEFLVPKETVVLRQWERSKQKFGFIEWVDKGWITTVEDLESWRFEC